MNKIEILQKLEKLNLNLDKIIVIGKAALVLQDIIEDVDIINLSCSSEVYDSLLWKIKNSEFFLKVKYYDCFEVETDFFDLDRVIQKSGFFIASLDLCYDFMMKGDYKTNKKIINKLDLILCSLDNYRYERKLRKQGITLIAGVDEVGRGPLVGPVVAACCILPDKFNLEGLTDSKKLSEKKREYFFEEIKKQAVAYGIGIVDEKRIDELNIYEATKVAMKEAIINMGVEPEHILIDAMPLNLNIPTTSIIKGDLKSITISAASVLAKVTRDRMLDELDIKYPMYDFKNNKGYPTKKHLAAIQEYGIIDEHRRSYGPVKDYIESRMRL